jgi:predicted transcriptional regulator
MAEVTCLVPLDKTDLTILINILNEEIESTALLIPKMEANKEDEEMMKVMYDVKEAQLKLHAKLMKAWSQQ